MSPDRRPHREVPRRGLEQAQGPSKNPQFSNEAKQNPKQLAHEDADLAELIRAWSALPDSIKAGIVAMVRASATTTPSNRLKGGDLPVAR